MLPLTHGRSDRSGGGRGSYLRLGVGEGGDGIYSLRSDGEGDDYGYPSPAHVSGRDTSSPLNDGDDLFAREFIVYHGLLGVLA